MRERVTMAGRRGNVRVAAVPGSSAGLPDIKGCSAAFLRIATAIVPFAAAELFSQRGYYRARISTQTKGVILMKAPSLGLSVIVLALLSPGPAAFAQLSMTISSANGPKASSVLLLTSARQAIKTCAFDSRNELLLSLESRLKTANDAMTLLARETGSLRPAVKSRFETALEEVKAKEMVLKLTMQNAKEATVKSWPEARLALASSYADYVRAVTDAEITANEDRRTS